ncbi:RNA methyltransferase [bacterium SCSIO 12741]|nr:RNA methyltransferase [bacterium SCSIO 12741]
MLSKNKVKLIRSLQQKKHRHEQGLFLVEGEKMVAELLAENSPTGKGIYQIQELLAVSDWLMEHESLIEEASFPVEEIKAVDLEKISALKTPNKVLAVVKMPQRNLRYMEDEMVLMLDGVRDPGNLGTIIRTADWFGVSEVICSLDTVDMYNPKVVQSTMGSLFRIPVSYRELTEAIFDLRINNPLKPVYGATTHGESIYQLDLSSNAIIVLGSESHGISENVGHLITKKISIPRFGAGESLNVASAAAVLCSEFKRLQYV